MCGVVVYQEVQHVRGEILNFVGRQDLRSGQSAIVCDEVFTVQRSSGEVTESHKALCDTAVSVQISRCCSQQPDRRNTSHSASPTALDIRDRYSSFDRKMPFKMEVQRPLAVNRFCFANGLNAMPFKCRNCHPLKAIGGLDMAETNRGLSCTGVAPTSLDEKKNTRVMYFGNALLVFVSAEAKSVFEKLSLIMRTWAAIGGDIIEMVTKATGRSRELMKAISGMPDDFYLKMANLKASEQQLPVAGLWVRSSCGAINRSGLAKSVAVLKYAP